MRRAAVSKACDACRRRKVKCSLGQPCASCLDAGLKCTFLTTRQRKGRKGASAHVINEIRNSQETTILSQTDHSSSTSQQDQPGLLHGASEPRPHSERLPTPIGVGAVIVSRPENLLPLPFDSLNYTSPTFSNLPESITSPQVDTSSTKPRFTRNAGLQPNRVVDEFAGVFLYDLSSTVPILNAELIEQTVSAATHNNDDEAYGLVCAFCAFVLLQTDMISESYLAVAGVHQKPSEYGQALLKEALAIRGHLDSLAIPSLQTLFLIFFIYGCHSALGKHRQAWYLLRETTTLYIAATMDSANEDLDEMFGPLFWLLLISERYLVELEQKIRTGVPASLDVVDTQLANIRVSQQWLRTIIWQLCTMLGYLSSDAVHENLTFRYPLKIAQDLAISTWKLPHHSMQMHGIGLTEKVFDITCTLIDVISCIPMEDVKSNGFEIGPEDNLKHFFSLIAKLPGGSDKYLPLLVTKVDQMLPSMVAPISRHIHLPASKQLVMDFDQKKT
ncbi:hypothetical protein H2204_006276 [Knufia peltigerae]|uniref:Zn(2)-C6 fungal-type domain-containing protein n=1 Tax=Knufia peltigerae TaxID=1002370 RepID=A0AA38Y408_9EURO|nr:hypothetical protein H2204_006276 [Knufia peltigerae]